MKNISNTLFAFGVCSALSLGAADVKPISNLADLKNRQTSQGGGYAESQLSRPEATVEIRSAKKDLMEHNCFLSGRLGYALVPKGSVVVLSEHFEKLTTVPERGKFMKWSEFARAHRANLQTATLTQEHLEGKGSRASLEEAIASCEEKSVTFVTLFRGEPAKIGNPINESPLE